MEGRSTDQGWVTAARSTLVFSLLFGVLFPFTIVFLAQRIFPWRADGSLVTVDHRPIGSVLVEQPFPGDRYFHGRPSAGHDNPMLMAASNEAPGNPALRRQVARRARAIERRDHVPASRIPVDIVTASGSGIAPDISPAAAYLQVARVAKAWSLPATRVRALVRSHVQARQWGIFGEPRVNVLMLNLALRRLAGDQ